MHRNPPLAIVVLCVKLLTGFIPKTSLLVQNDLIYPFSINLLN